MNNLQKTDSPSYDEVLAKLTETEQLLKEAELRLCESEIEKAQLAMKYAAAEHQNAYWKEYAETCKNGLDVILNSKTWKLRNSLIAPFRRLLSKQTDNESGIAPTIAEAIKQVTPLPALPQNNGWDSSFYESTKIAFQVHAFYPDLMVEICNILKPLPYRYDLYVTTTEQFNATYLEDYLHKHSTAQKIVIDVVENKGRDVIPFLKQMQPVLSQYDYICHLHTKRSLHTESGNLWRTYLFDNLIGSPEQIGKIMYELESNPDIGIIFPEIYASKLRFMNLGADKDLAFQVLDLLSIDSSKLTDDLIFPAGTMFWVRSTAAQDMFSFDFDTLEVPEEAGQVDETIMHAIERLWVYVVEQRGYRYRMFKNISKAENF